MSADPALPPAGARALVHGLGRFGGGLEATRHLRRRGCEVRVADRSDAADLQEVAAAFGDRGVDWQLGREDAALLDDVDLVVTSPAVPDDSSLLQEARRRGLPITQECELFLAAYPGRVVGVTGTNGKSSTATLMHRALTRAGVDALLGGNIGHSLLADEASWRADQVAVLEMSSFQLERLAPGREVHGAVFTRVGRDHLDRHGTLARYRAAKGRLAAAATAFVVHAADDPVAASYPSRAAQRGYYSLEAPGPGSAGVRDGFVEVRVGRAPARPLLHKDALALLGDFQLENVMASALAALWLGADARPTGLALATAQPLPYRLQLLHVVDGVHVFDNSVSTEVESTRQALRALRARGRQVRWLGGGKSKDGDYAAVAAALQEHAASAHVFGAAAAPLVAAIDGGMPVTGHEHLEDALGAAMAGARPGDAVLFSPAFASFDQYPNFRARAREFHRLVRERRAADAARG